jgi:hypothetical protein
MLTEEHDAVNTMIDRGASFDHIEQYIDTLVLPEAQLGALWLLAWAEASRPRHPPTDSRRNAWLCTMSARQSGRTRSTWMI